MARAYTLPADKELGLTLDRYQEIMGLPINGFNGLNDPDEEPHYNCGHVWKQRERDYVARFLALAEEMRQRELGYHISPKYLASQEETYENPLVLPNKYLISVGLRTETDIETVTLDLGVADAPNDPVEFTVTVAFSDEDELKVFYPGEDAEIHPSSISISGTTATVKIPRARLIDPDYLDNRSDPLAYSGDNSYFLATVDVKRVYYDESEGAKYVWLDCTAGKVYQTARPVIRNNRLAIVDLFPASYSDGSWSITGFTQCSCGCAHPERVCIHYLSGIQSDMYTELLTARLSHTLMPYKPVDCEAVSQYWQQDTEPEKTRTAYGYKRGAVDAWVADSRAKVGIGGMFV